MTALLLALLVAGPAAAEEEDWHEVPPGEQPWAEADPDAPPQQMLQPLHRRLPRFYLGNSVFVAPQPLLLADHGSSTCGSELDAMAGVSLDFDFRFWYLFVGSHLAVYGNAEGGQDLTVGEYALRGGAIIPFGEHFAIVHAVWLGGARWDAAGADFDAPFDGLQTSERKGFLAGTSLGVRVMLASWFGLTADVGISTILFDEESSPDGEIRLQWVGETQRPTEPPADGERLNRWQVSSGIVFAW
jgi:hypothetical protein